VKAKNSDAEMDVERRLSRSKLKHAQPGAECHESGTLRSEWEVGKAISPSTPNVRFVHAESGGKTRSVRVVMVSADALY
jgi:hypothetical protein